MENTQPQSGLDQIDNLKMPKYPERNALGLTVVSPTLNLFLKNNTRTTMESRPMAFVQPISHPPKKPAKTTDALPAEESPQKLMSNPISETKSVQIVAARDLSELLNLPPG